MKRLFFAFIFLFPANSFAQEISTAVGIETGFSISSLTYRRAAFRSQNLSQVNMGVAFHVGSTAHVQVSNQFAFRPSIYYKWFTLINSSGISLYDVEVPLNCLYTLNRGRGALFFIGAGPNIQYSFKGTGTTANGVEPIFIGDRPTDFIGAFSLALNLKLGWQHPKGFTYNMYANIGRYNRSNNPEFILRSNDILGFNFGYLFNVHQQQKNGM